MDLNQEGEKTSGHKQGKSSSQHLQNAVLWIVLVLVVVLSTCALALSIYASVAKTDHDSKLKETNAQLERIATTIDNMSSLLLHISNTSTYLALNSLQTLFQELNNTVENQLPQELDETVTDLSVALNQAFITQQSHFQELNTSVSRSLLNLFGQFQQVNETTAELNNTLHELSINLSGQRSNTNNYELDLTAGCTATITSTCVLNHNNVGSPPTSLTCETPEHPLEEAGFRNVNIYCSVDNSVGEVNPVTSTLNIFSGEVSCLCSLVALTAPTASPQCILTIQRCPDTIMFNITNTGTRSQLT